MQIVNGVTGLSWLARAGIYNLHALLCNLKIKRLIRHSLRPSLGSLGSDGDTLLLDDFLGTLSVTIKRR